MRIHKENKVISKDPIVDINQQQRDQNTSTLVSLGIKTAKTIAKLDKKENNNLFLSAEEHVFGEERNGTRIDGVPGATNTKDPQIFLSNVTTIYGIDFKGSIQIGATACVVFNNCRFAKTISIADGGQAQFIGCYFYNVGTIYNNGPVLNVYTIGTVNKTGILHTNVTVIAEIT